MPRSLKASFEKAAPGRPSKEWWDKMYKEVKEGNPKYTEEQARATVGDIWYNKMSPSKKQEEVKKEKKGFRAVAYVNRAEPDMNLSVFVRGPEEKYRMSGTVQEILEEAEANKIPQDIVNAAMTTAIDEDMVVLTGKAASRILVSEVEKIAETFPNLLSNDAKKWIQIETARRASNLGIPATPEQANAFIEKAAEEVTKTLADSIRSGVKQVIDEHKEDLLDTLLGGSELESAPQMPVTGPMVPPDMTTAAPAPPTASLRVSASPGLRVRAQEMDILRDVDIDGFRLVMWDTGRTDKRGQSYIGYEFYDRAGNTLFSGEDFAGSPMHADDADETVKSLLGFLTLRPGDTDAEYFENYTEEQMDFAQTDAEVLQMYTLDDLEDIEFKDWSGQEA